MAIEWIPLGMSMAGVLVRAVSLADKFEWNTVADLLEDAEGAVGPIGRWLREKTVPPSAQLIGYSLSNNLSQKHREYIQIHIPEVPEALTQDVINLVARVISQLAPHGDASANSRLLLTALTEPDTFPAYVRKHGGDRMRQSEVPTALEPLFDYLLESAAEQLCRLARTSPQAAVEASAKTIRMLNQIHEAVVPRKPLIDLATLQRATSTAREASRPKYLPPIDRREEFGVTDHSLMPAPLVILGEGGAGKSVVAGDLVDWTAGGCVLIPCSRVPANADLSTVSAIDAALGCAAADTADGLPLTHILASLPVGVMVVIDTIDLLLSADTADNLNRFLTRLVPLCDLVVTCRTQEWTDLMVQHPLPEHRLGLLSSDQVAVWVDRFLGVHQEISADQASSFQRSVERAIREREGQVLLGSPVRLAMACSMYAGDGELPADLSVARLYLDYWDHNISRDRRGRRATAEAEAQETTALKIAAILWRRSSTRLALFTARQGLPAASVQDLLSSGLLKTYGHQLVGFFHQTFAEFAIAQHLASEGDDADMRTLGRSLAANSPGHWGIARYLAWAPMDRDLTLQLAGHIPTTAEGLRVLLRLLSSHDTAEALRESLAKLAASDAVQVRRVFTALADADETAAPVVVQSALSLLTSDGPGLTDVVSTLARVIPKLSIQKREEALFAACHHLITLGGQVLTDLFRLLTATILRTDERINPDVVLAQYAQMGPAAQRVMVKAYLDANPGTQAGFLTVALAAECPSKAVDELVDIAVKVWEDLPSRTRLGWTTWQVMLDHVYPGVWNAVQVRLANHILRDEQACRELLGALLDPEASLDRRRYTNTAAFAAQQHPELVVHTLITNPLAYSRRVVGNVCTILKYLPSQTADVVEMLLGRLEELIPLDPRRVLAAMIGIAVGTQHEDRPIALLVRGRSDHRSEFPRAAIDSAWDALMSRLNQASYWAHHAQLETLVSGTRIEDRRRRSKMLGRDALDDASAWLRLKDLVYDRGQPDASKLAIEQVLRVYASMPPAAHPLIDLISTPHGGCARMIAEAFGERLPDRWAPEDITLLTARLECACNAQSEDVQIAGAILALIVKIAHQEDGQALVNESTVKRLLRSYGGEVVHSLRESETVRAGALLDQWLGCITRIGIFRLPSDALDSHLVDLLSTIDTAQIGSNATRNLAASLVSVTRNAPHLWHALSKTWRTISSANQNAVAEALIKGHISGGREIALDRSREPDCPPAVAQRIHQLLNT